MISEHPDYEKETRYLSHTLQELEKSLAVMKEQAKQYAEEIKDTNARRQVLDESSQEYIDLMVGSALLSYSSGKAESLEAVREAPYFARIDFKEQGHEQTDCYYLGKTSIIQEEDQKLLVIDWRAPVSNLYYEGRIGYNEYSSPGGTIAGQLSRKRQYVIHNRQLEDISDVDIVTNDSLLSSCLESNATNRLKEIVGTIQAEQNQIIRYDLWKSLIVQGSAGAGKTTVALHRIAYLLYAYNGAIGGDDFMILGPNRFFLNYISSVLPDLGVGEVMQSTFEDFAELILGRRFHIQDQHEKLRCFLDIRMSQEEKERLRQESIFKSSQAFINVCDNYLHYLEENYLPKEDLLLVGQPLISYKELQQLFMVSYRHLCYEKRVQEIKKHIRTIIKKKKEQLAQTVEQKCLLIRNQFAIRYPEGPQRQKAMQELYDKRDRMLRQLEMESKRILPTYLKKMPKEGGFERYKQLFTDNALYERFVAPAAPDNADYIRTYTLENLKKKRLELEDLPPAMLLQVSIKGLARQERIRHVVIDEAQDLSLFQFYMLHRIFKSCTFTILGDLYQGIHGYRSITDWSPIEKMFLPDEQNPLRVLQKSYRTTIEVVDAASSIMEKLGMNPAYQAIPFLRHGDPVALHILQDENAILQHILTQIRLSKEKKGYITFALITRNIQDAVNYHAKLKTMDACCQLILEEDDNYQGGFSILPTYLAKGMEFDQVFIPDVDAEHYPVDDMNGKLLYVAMTRALHSLHLYRTDTQSLTPLLDVHALE